MKPLEQVLTDARGEIPDTQVWPIVLRQLRHATPDAWWTVYGLFDPREPKCLRYIGVTQNVRLRYFEHATHAGSSVAAWSHALRDAGIPMGLRVLRRFSRAAEAFRTEHQLLLVYRAAGQCALNQSLAAYDWARPAPEGFRGWPTPPAWALEVRQ